MLIFFFVGFVKSFPVFKSMNNDVPGLYISDKRLTTILLSFCIGFNLNSSSMYIPSYNKFGVSTLILINGFCCLY